MENQEIKKEKERCFEQIKVAKERLEEIRKICKHEKTYENDYMWRIGSTVRANICEYCGEFISQVKSNETNKS